MNPDERAALALAAEEEMFSQEWELDHAPLRRRRRPPNVPGKRQPQFADVCADCNPPGSPFVPAVAWVEKGAYYIVRICTGCDRKLPPTDAEYMDHLVMEFQPDYYQKAFEEFQKVSE